MYKIYLYFPFLPILLSTLQSIYWVVFWVDKVIVAMSIHTISDIILQARQETKTPYGILGLGDLNIKKSHLKDWKQELY